jgi:glycosyltransferase involved in cell wall biosynthesis
MDRKERTAVVFTAAIVGGHELMTVAHIKKYQKKGFDITCYVPRNNHKLKKILSEKSIQYKEHGVLHKRLEIIHAFINPLFRKSAFKLLKELDGNFQRIILIQGDIELGSVFVNCAKKIGLKKVISYIPYAHSFRLMGSKFACLKDFLSRYVYNNCDKYITISKVFASDLRSKNTKANVKILHNFVEILTPGTVRDVDYKFERKKDTFVILMAGRVFFRQKGQDILLAALKKIATNKYIIVKVVGDGPDLAQLKEISLTLPKHVHVEFFGWQSNVWQHSRDVNTIVIPSLYEGVPLLMLEALKVNVPVIAPARDGMSDYLNESSLYRTGNRENEIQALANKIDKMIEAS